MDGLGNKFIIVDRRKNFVNISKEKIIHLSKLESFHRDIGFDQLIFIEKEVDKFITLPLHAELTDEEVNYILKNLKKFKYGI